jgi:hypothetical protein
MFMVNRPGKYRARSPDQIAVRTHGFRLPIAPLICDRQKANV